MPYEVPYESFDAHHFVLRDDRAIYGHSESVMEASSPDQVVQLDPPSNHLPSGEVLQGDGGPQDDVTQFYAFTSGSSVPEVCSI